MPKLVQRHERQNAPAVISPDFSLDRLIDESIPPDVPLSFVKVAGPMSYCATENIKHGDYLGIIPDHDDNPDALLLVRIGPSYFIRRRRAVEWMIRRFSIHILGHMPKKNRLFEVLGLVLMVTHFPPVNYVTAPPVIARPPSATSSPLSGPKRLQNPEEGEEV